MSVSKAFMNAFDKLGSQGNVLAQIEENTAATKESVAVGGDLYEKVDQLVQEIKNIQTGSLKGALSNSANAIAMALIAPSMEPIGKGLQLIVDAINNLEGTGEETKEKTEGLIAGLVLLGDVGKSILAFAGYMVLATPLLMVAALAAPFIGIALFATVMSVKLATKFIEKEDLDKLENLQAVGLGILAIMASLALSSLIIVPAMKGALGAVVIFGALGLIFGLMPKKALDGMKEASDSLLMLGLGILAVSTSLALVGLIMVPALKGLLVASGIILGLGLVFAGLVKLKIIDKIEEGSKGLLFAAGAILGLGIALALFNVITPPLEALLNVAMVVGAVGIAFGLIGLVSKFIEKGAKAMLWASLSILALGLSIKAFTMLVGGISMSVETFAPLLLIGAIGLVFGIAGAAAKFIVKGAVAMIIAGVSLLVIGAGIAVMRKAFGENGWELLGQTAALVVGLGLAMAGAGAAAMFIIPGAAAMILAGGALIAIGAGMMVLRKLNFKEMTKSSGVLGDSGKKTKGFLGIGGGRPKTNMEVMFEAIAVSFMLNPFHVAAMYAGAPALIMAGGALLSIGAGIKSFMKIAESTDLPKLGTNVNLIVSALADNFARIGREYPGGGTGILGALFGGGGGSVVAQGISAVSGMGRALTGIAKGVQSMANLKFPTGFDKDGNPTGFETIDVGTVVPGLIKNTKLLVAGLSEVFAEVGQSEAAQGSSWFTSSAYEKGIKVVKKMGTPLYNLAKGVQNMANLKFPTGYDKDGNATGYESIGSVGALIPKLTKNTKELILGLSQVFQEIGQGDAQTSSWWQGSTTFEKGIEVAGALGKPYEVLGKTIEHVTKIMDFDFDGAALKARTTAMVAAFLAMGMVVQGQDIDMDDAADFVQDVSKSYQSMSRSVPKMVSAIAEYDVEKGDMFATQMTMLTGGPQATVEQMQARTALWKQIGKSVSTSADNFPGITEAINDMDLAKLTESRQMFEALAVLSQGGEPTDILESMGESLEQALQNLADMLAEFKTTVGDGMAATAESGGLISGAIDGVKSFISGGRSGGSSSGGDSAATVNAIKQLARVLTAKGVKISNIDDLT
tara:strand:+ start:3167 stop:6409 length:3243 start_codon:yes stop_codon:yes gene_type:complete